MLYSVVYDGYVFFCVIALLVIGGYIIRVLYSARLVCVCVCCLSGIVAECRTEHVVYST